MSAWVNDVVATPPSNNAPGPARFPRCKQLRGAGAVAACRKVTDHARGTGHDVERFDSDRNCVDRIPDPERREIEPDQLDASNVIFARQIDGKIGDPVAIDVTFSVVTPSALL